MEIAFAVVGLVFLAVAAGLAASYIRGGKV